MKDHECDMDDDSSLAKYEDHEGMKWYDPDIWWGWEFIALDQADEDDRLDGELNDVAAVIRSGDSMVQKQQATVKWCQFLLVFV